MDNPIDTLFDARLRNNMRWKRNTETDYAYLNQSGRPEWEQTRSTLEQWFQRFPRDGRKDLLSRFRKDGKPTEGAFFELLLHEFFCKLGCELHLHPDVPSTTKHPDFLVRHCNKEFYLEAVVRSQSESQFAMDKHTLDALDKLNDIKSPHFGVVVEGIEGVLERDIPANRIQSPFLECLKQLDPLAYPVGDEVPGIVKIAEGDWLLEGSLVRVSKSEEDEFILIHPGGGGWDNTPAKMLKVLQRKANRYGKPKLPIVIALNWCDTLGSKRDEAAVVEALYAGHVDNDRKPPSITVRYRTDTYEPVDIIPGEAEKGSGLFTRASGDPKYSHVAAILVFQRASLYLNYLSYRLYLNPNASNELPDVLRELRHATVVEGKGERQYKGGITISNLAGDTLARVNSLPISMDGKQVLEWHDGKSAGEILGIDAASDL